MTTVKLENYNNIKNEMDETDFKNMEDQDLLDLIKIDLEEDLNFELTKKILHQNNNILIQNNQHDLNLLFYIASKKFDKVIEYILDKIESGYYLNLFDSNKRNLLFYLTDPIFLTSIQNKISLEDLKKLNQIDKNGFKPIYFASLNKNMGLIELLIKIDSELSGEEIEGIIIEASKTYNVSEFDSLLKLFLLKGRSFSMSELFKLRDRNDEDLLTISLKYENFELAYSFLKKGILFQNNEIIKNNFHLFISNIKSINLLLNNGFNVNSKNKEHDHAIYFLIGNKNIDTNSKKKILDLMIKKQFNVNLHDENENNLLHYCIMFNENKDIIDYLKRKEIIDNQNIDNLNSVDLENKEEAMTKYIRAFNLKYEHDVNENLFDDLIYSTK